MKQQQLDLTVTEQAAEEIGTLLSGTEGNPSGIRFNLVRTQCMGGRGFGYELIPAGEVEDSEIILQEKGINVIIDPDHRDRLEGTKIDFVSDRKQTGFRIENPNATGQCPCGNHDLFDGGPGEGHGGPGECH